MAKAKLKATAKAGPKAKAKPKAVSKARSEANVKARAKATALSRATAKAGPKAKAKPKATAKVQANPKAPAKATANSKATAKVSKARPKRASAGRLRVPRDDGELFRVRAKRRVPFEFVLDELAPLDPQTKPMFGCFGVYTGDKIVFALRERPSATHDNGVWLATTVEHHAALSAEFPSMRSISVLGDGVTGWQILPAAAPDFEDSVLRACRLVLRGDPRIGKVPTSRRRR